jgi:ketosteroid isomerase-like protein
MNSTENRLQEIVEFFESMQSSDVFRLHEIYCSNAKFKDPFNQVQGTEAIGQIFSHMFASMKQPRFVVTTQLQQGSECFLTWDFLFSIPGLKKGSIQTIRGASHLKLKQENGVWKIEMHRDYWDAAEELYSKLPVLGSLMRWLQRRFTSSHFAQR